MRVDIAAPGPRSAPKLSRFLNCALENLFAPTTAALHGDLPAVKPDGLHALAGSSAPASPG